MKFGDGGADCNIRCCNGLRQLVVRMLVFGMVLDWLVIGLGSCWLELIAVSVGGLPAEIFPVAKAWT